MKRAARRPTASSRRVSRPRKTIYELPPLELECMKALWDLEEATVRDIREQLAAAARPLAYTTVETIMDRLTRKGAVERRKVGKAHRYTPVYEKANARAQAVAALTEHFFDGSRQALVAHLSGSSAGAPRRTLRSLAPPRAGLATAAKVREQQVPSAGRRPAATPARTGRAAPASHTRAEAPIDTSLL
jgi:predicted transcriptional regulator